MRRGLANALLVACLLLVGVETEAGSLVFGAPCLASCPDDGLADRCSPVCATCACASHGRPGTLVSVASGRGPEASGPHADVAVVPEALPRTDEIEHVPKRASC